ncbi:type II secretion system F family protein [Agrococcus sp. Marseille-P2731]|uniref:type II secretion system F family protein n=1 Tax=Agrococcus sp. Marseille-P2731 TaxID=1841862 RepID=UPI00093161A3|nr:type II secretion system F family protein [Agrococcus sp. Marseille-P2731]
MSAEVGWSLILGTTLGFGVWMLVSLVPLFRRPLLLHRVAPYVLDVSSGARDLMARRRINPLGIVGVVASPVGDRLTPVVHAVLGAPDGIRRRLRQAAAVESVGAFRGRQLRWAVLCGAAGTALGVVGAMQGGPVALPAALGALAAAIGAFAVDWLVQRQAKRRLARISSELPSILEFVSLSLAAGEGLQDALRRVGAAGQSALGRELAGVVADAAAGSSLSSALAALSEELDHPGVSRCVDQMRGALERGTPLAQTLQAQALDAREAAKRALLEAAGRKEISMLVPLVFGLLPTTVAFALWPGIHVLQVGF